MLRQLLRGAALLLLSLAAACGSHVNYSEQAQSLGQTISRIQSAPTPDGVDASVYSSLKAELIRVLKERHVSKFVSGPPQGSLNCVKDLCLVAIGGKWYLRWTYRNSGDNDQNSEVNISDLTPIGAHYGQRSGTVLWDSAQLADADGNGEVNISDITPIGANYMNRVAGYNVYGSTDASDLPSRNGGANGPGTISLGFIDFDQATKVGSSKTTSDSSKRLQFLVEVNPSTQHPYYWIAPVEVPDGPSGEPSLASGGDPAGAPTLTMQNPPAGAGSPVMPYELTVNEHYTFKLMDPADGDVSASAEAHFYISDPYAGTFSGPTVTTTANYPGGFFTVWATYKGIPLASGGGIYCHIEAGYIPSDLQFTAWVPAWVSGAGSPTSPYTNAGLYAGEDAQTDFSVIDPTDGDVSNVATFTVDPPVAEVHMDWADDLYLKSDAVNWGAFTVTANYNGKQARLYFDLTRAAQLSLRNPPAQGDGTQANPYHGDIDTTYQLLLTEVTNGDVTGGTDTWENGWTSYTIGDTYTAPEDMGNLYGNWYTKDIASNTAATGFQDSFQGGPDRPCWIDGKFSITRGDSSENAYSNRIWMVLDQPALMAPDQFTMYHDAVTGDPISFYETMWVNQTEGYGTIYDNSNWETWCDVYHTTDGGATWTKMGRAEGGNTGNGASMWLNMWPDQMWYSTYFSGFGISGSGGYSMNNGLSWTDEGATIQASWDPDPLDGITPNFPIGRYARAGYGMPADRLWVVGGEYRPYIAYTDNFDGGPHSWMGWTDIGLSWLEPAGVGGELVVKGQDPSAHYQFKRFDPGTSSFLPWEAVFPPDFDKDNCSWAYGTKSNVLALLHNASAPYILLTTPDGGRTMHMAYDLESDPTAQQVLPYAAMALDDGTIYMAGYKSEGQMVGGYVGQRQVVKSVDGGTSWQLMLSQYAGWSGVGSYDIGFVQDYTNSVHLTRRASGAEWGQCLLP